jgi:hypothetical protein
VSPLTAASLLSLALLLPVGTRAEEGASPPEPSAAAPEAAHQAPAPDLTVKPPPPLDFVLLDEKLGERPADKALAAVVARRRAFLQAHQAAGLATWALMGTTVVYGRLDYADRYFGEETEKYSSTHEKLGWTTGAAFAFTGLLAALAPEPYPRKPRLDTTTLHKGSMALATLGVVSQLVLGVGIRRGLGNLEERQLANAHQAVGLGTFAAMSVGAVTLVF